MLAYRASTLTFLNVTWPRLLYLASMDLCSPPKRKLEVVSSASLKGGLALLEAFGADGAPVYTVYSHTTHDDKPDEEAESMEDEGKGDDEDDDESESEEDDEEEDEEEEGE